MKTPPDATCRSDSVPPISGMTLPPRLLVEATSASPACASPWSLDALRAARPILLGASVQKLFPGAGAAAAEVVAAAAAPAAPAADDFAAYHAPRSIGPFSPRERSASTAAP